MDLYIYICIIHGHREWVGEGLGGEGKMGAGWKELMGEKGGPM